MHIILGYTLGFYNNNNNNDHRYPYKTINLFTLYL